MLAYADVCWRMLTYDDVCWRTLTCDDVCLQVQLLLTNLHLAIETRRFREYVDAFLRLLALLVQKYKY
jgi:hypothetical protein